MEKSYIIPIGQLKSPIGFLQDNEEVLQDSYRTIEKSSIGFLQDNGSPIGILQDSYRIPIGCLQDAYRIPIGILQDSYRIPIGHFWKSPAQFVQDCPIGLYRTFLLGNHKTQSTVSPVLDVLSTWEKTIMLNILRRMTLCVFQRCGASQNLQLRPIYAS